MRDGFENVTRIVQIEFLHALAGHALDHGDEEKALELAEEAGDVVDAGRWTMQYHLPLLARNAAVLHRAGESDRARGQIDAAFASFEEDPEAIVNMFRGGALRPIAESYHAMGLRDQALVVYARAAEEGVVNLNSRPRAIDLSETCLSLAVEGIRPTEALHARLVEIHDALGDPW